ncbi:MAG: DUF4388 domain-containing protein [Acidobacteria bacterium]|nr:DUF4388 domain-containing protein [Acidobacteriota bacterium]MBI3656051.1 DUF4388 domain-containing protein [Acidobacteriota bacterium]
MAEILSGDLTSLRLVDILRVLKLNYKTGRLNLSHQSGNGEIYVNRGDIVHASWRDCQGEDAIYVMLAWSKGAFVFAPLLTTEATTLTTSTQDILAKGDVIDKEWDGIRDVIPSCDTVFNKAEAPPADFHLAELERAILQQVDGSSTITDVADRLQKSELETSRVIRKLFLLGLIENADKGIDLKLEATLDVAVFDVIQLELTKVIGPIAPVILAEQIDHMGESQHAFPKHRLAELAELLSREIPSESRQIRFQQAMVQLLKKV